MPVVLSKPIKCFYLEPTDRERRYLRRYVSSSDPDSKCSACGGYHDVMVQIEDAQAIIDGEGYHRSPTDEEGERLDGDPRWPTVYPCGRAISDEDQKQIFTLLLYTRTDTGELMTLREAPPGAMWDAWWMRHGNPKRWCGPDGKSLVVKCPDGHEWMVDAQASNCTIPDDHEQLRHHCWVRHGEVPNITVDKSGVTCNAGAGSILTPNWHGFLRNGYLVQA